MLEGVGPAITAPPQQDGDAVPYLGCPSTVLGSACVALPSLGSCQSLYLHTGNLLQTGSRAWGSLPVGRQA